VEKLPFVVVFRLMTPDKPGDFTVERRVRKIKSCEWDGAEDQSELAEDITDQTFDVLIGATIRDLVSGRNTISVISFCTHVPEKTVSRVKKSVDKYCCNLIERAESLKKSINNPNPAKWGDPLGGK
jgi:hypothetical protein